MSNQCEKCKTIENLVINAHPKATFHILCGKCIDNLSMGSSDRIMFNRLQAKANPSAAVELKPMLRKK